MVRRVTLVYGPPCGGKTTWVAERSRPGDVVLDFDDIARQYGSKRQWRHDPAIAAQAESVMRHRMRELKNFDGVAFIIRAAPTLAQRAEIDGMVGLTDAVACVPSVGACLARARRDRRPEGTVGAIRRWFAAYEEAE